MPFICDDFEWKLVSDHEPYDKNRFVIVRTLSVKPNKRTPIRKFSVDQIRERIEKFGEIESIKVLPTNESEAYVTFVSDRSAYLMLLQHEFDKRTYKTQPFDVLPADSWDQPPENNIQLPEDTMEVDGPEQTPEIFMLNEDCLLHLFKFMDIDSLVNLADVCQMFHRLLHQHCFPRIQAYKVTNDDDPEFTLAKLRRTMLCIGPHITDLSYEHEYDEEEGMSRTTKFLRVIAQNTGQNIRRASFEFSLDRDNRMAILAPILQNLESLEMADKNEGSIYHMDFQALCPNLIEFIVNMDMPMVADCKPWPSLRSLSVKNNQTLETKTLISFIKQNPQLTALEFATDKSNKTLLILAITKYLSRFEKLTIVNTIDGSIFARNFTSLSNIPLLCEINLERLDKGSLKIIINHLPTFTNLRKISLECKRTKSSEMGDYEQSLVNLAQLLSHLEDLRLHGIPINEEVLVNIASSSHKLRALFIRDCGIVFTNDLIVKLGEQLKVSRQESNDALQLYLDKKDLGKLDTAKNKEFRSYLQLKHA